MARILIPLPDRDFDVTEVAVPWRLLTRAGHQIVFSTERGGEAPAADPEEPPAEELPEDEEDESDEFFDRETSARRQTLMLAFAAVGVGLALVLIVLFVAVLRRL